MAETFCIFVSVTDLNFVQYDCAFNMLADISKIHAELTAKHIKVLFEKYRSGGILIKEEWQCKFREGSFSNFVPAVWVVPVW